MAVAPRIVPQPLTQPVYDPNVRRVNYFNGRMLSAEDLGAEQAANQAEMGHFRRLLDSVLAGAAG